MKRIVLLITAIIFVLAPQAQASWVDDHLFDKPGPNYDQIWEQRVNSFCEYTKVVLVSKDRPREIVLAPCLEYTEDDEHGPAWLTWHIAANPSTGLPMRTNETYWSYEKWLAFTKDGQLYYSSGGLKVSEPSTAEKGEQ